MPKKPPPTDPPPPSSGEPPKRTPKTPKPQRPGGPPRKSRAVPKPEDAPKKPKRPPHRVRKARAEANAKKSKEAGLDAPKKGRPLLLTEAVTKAITNALKVGSYLHTAIAMGGISQGTFHAWIKRGQAERERREAFDVELATVQRQTDRWAEMQVQEVFERQKEGPYLAFLEDVTLAVADAEVTALTRVFSAAKEDWRAAAWLLERRAPTRWGRRVMEMNAQTDAAAVDATRIDELGEPTTKKPSEGNGARAKLAAALGRIVANKTAGQAATAQITSDNGTASAEKQDHDADSVGTE